ncbi:phospholipase a2 [Plakobranchus ocellatus]|uniref:phospholipase A2 n=1 Tax=Plakobranchus ocellatus TaxID=259542 RepID=A0AAV4C566_9GAST|nr:phospholipase a2 [Plakobranchus ocellatus]
MKLFNVFINFIYFLAGHHLYPPFLTILLLHPVSAKFTDYVILSVSDNGLQELRLFYRGVHLLETSLAYQRPGEGGVSFTRATDGQRVVATAGHFGLIEDCAVKTSAGELRHFMEEFFLVPFGENSFREWDVMDVYLGAKNISDPIFSDIHFNRRFNERNRTIHHTQPSSFLYPTSSKNFESGNSSHNVHMSFPPSNKSKTSFVLENLPKRHTSTYHSAIHKHYLFSKVFEPYQLHARLAPINPDKDGFLKLFQHHLDIKRESEECREFYKQAREKLMSLHSLADGDDRGEDRLETYPSDTRTRNSSISGNHLEPRVSSVNPNNQNNRKAHHHSRQEKSVQRQKQHHRHHHHHNHHQKSQWVSHHQAQRSKNHHRLRHRKNLLRRLKASSLSHSLTTSNDNTIQAKTKGINSTLETSSLSSSTNSIPSTSRTDLDNGWKKINTGADSSRLVQSKFQATMKAKPALSSSFSSNPSSIYSNSSQGKQLGSSNARSVVIQRVVEFASVHSLEHSQPVARDDVNNSKSSNNEPSHPSRVKRDLLSGYLIFPGTKWCGDGDIAKHRDDLGAQEEVDKCCRRHDLCPLAIPRLSSKFDYFNYRLHTLCHCHCDRKFRRCLERSTSPLAEIVGQLYFNMIRPQCFKLRETQTCVHSLWWGGCREYATTKVAYTKTQRRFKTREHRRMEAKRKMRKGKIKEARRLKKTLRKRKRKNRRKRLRLKSLEVVRGKDDQNKTTLGLKEPEFQILEGFSGGNESSVQNSSTIEETTFNRTLAETIKNNTIEE